MNEYLIAQRRWLEFLIKGGSAALGYEVPITDTGYDLVQEYADLVYERGGHRFEVRIRDLGKGDVTDG